MKQILLLGGGIIGEMIADLLASSGDYTVTVADNSKKNLEKFSGQKNIETLARNHVNIQKYLEGKQVVKVVVVPNKLVNFVVKVCRY